MTGEHAPKPGATWETVITRTEHVIDTTGPDLNQPATPRPNRATRRALAKAARRRPRRS